jgi:hypothetical protein
MPKLVTTNLRFPEESYRELQLQARRCGTTLAGLVREAVEQYLGRDQLGRALALGADPADGLIGCLEGSAGDESSNHDHYLYGWPKESGKRRR